jgi:hypothetical protein
MDLIADRGRLFQSPSLPDSPWNGTIPLQLAGIRSQGMIEIKHKYLGNGHVRQIHRS